MGTAWFAADAANVKPGKTVAVVGDGAVGLLGVLAAKQTGAERIIAMSRHESRQKLAHESLHASVWRGRVEGDDCALGASGTGREMDTVDRSSARLLE